MHHTQFGEQLETGDLKIHIIQQATSYQVLNTIESNRAEYEKFTVVLEDMSTRLGKTFTLSRDQLVSVRWCIPSKNDLDSSL